MWREVEVKLAVVNPDEARKALLGEGFKYLDTCFEVDTYYSHPCRNFAESDEALRLRKRVCSSGSSYTLTYKGPRQRATGEVGLKVREEVEVHLEEEAYESIKQLLGKLGFVEVASFSKKREIYESGGGELEASLDELHGVGYFLEIEARSRSAQARLGELVERVFKNYAVVEETYLEICIKTRRCVVER